MLSGIINIYKEKGYTSFDVVAKLRGILKIKKIGHTGTLDPDATGVLPVCLGKATKICDLITDWDKEYEAVMLLGLSTETQDISGNVIDKRPVTSSPGEVTGAVMSFVGEYMQVPPMYSALKVGGKRLYELAREGITVERKARLVNIYDITILDIDLPRVTMRVRCSKGTYIRTLCNDIGEKLGCLACMEKLTRTRVGIFDIEDAIRIDDIALCHDMSFYDTSFHDMSFYDTSFIRPIDTVFSDYPKLVVRSDRSKLLYNGNKLGINSFTEEEPSGNMFRIYDEGGNFAGIYEKCDGYYKPVRMFI